MVNPGPHYSQTLLRSALMAESGITGLFSLRSGGASPQPFDSLNFGRDLGDSDANIDANLETLRKEIGLYSPPHQVKQIHGSHALWCNGPGVNHDCKADVLLTDQPGTALAVRTADCLPILLADPQTGIAAAVHAGWRGTALNVSRTAVRQMLSGGAQVKDILASLGPCIGPCCYKIDGDTAGKLAKCAPGAEKAIRRGAEITADLNAINTLQLLQCGLNEAKIESFNACTSCDNSRFFSYRRDGKRTGRHLAVVALPRKP